MKKFLAMLLAAVMVIGLAACGSTPAETQAAAEAATQAVTEAATQAATEAATEAAAKEVIEVNYYCSIGAYLATLQSEIDKFNEGEGKEKGIYINLISNINSYGTDLNALMEAGTHYDIIHGDGRQDWYQKGWLMDLHKCNNPEIDALVESYKDCKIEGTSDNGDEALTIVTNAYPIKLAVNTDLFEKNNLELPKTWDDVVECAKVITENGNGIEFGFGWSTFSIQWRRLCFKFAINSTGTGWWNPNTASYDFSVFRKPAEAIRTMYENGWMLGADDLDIDPIRAQFSEGVIGMFPAPSYDYAVYSEQFPAKCNWTVIDPPTIEEGEAPYKGVFFAGTGTMIDAVAYDAADDAKKKAIEEAWLYINSDEVNQTAYEMGGIIPTKTSIAAGAEVSEKLGPQWAIFGDLTNYAIMSQFPDSVIPLEGDDYETVFDSYMHGNVSFDDAVADLNKRYNDAYQILKQDGEIDTSIYEYEYDISR